MLIPHKELPVESDIEAPNNLYSIDCIIETANGHKLEISLDSFCQMFYSLGNKQEQFIARGDYLSQAINKIPKEEQKWIQDKLLPIFTKLYDTVSTKLISSSTK